MDTDCLVLPNGSTCFLEPSVNDYPRPIIVSSETVDYIEIPNDMARAGRVAQRIERDMRHESYPHTDVLAVRLALEEAFANAVTHGNRSSPDKKLHIQYQVYRDHCIIHLADEGPGFDPSQVPDPTAPENMERPSGRGILLMRHCMSEVTYHRPGNRLTMIKRRTA